MRMEGRWDTVIKIWKKAGSAPEVVEGISMNKMVLGNRFLHRVFRSTRSATPVEGYGFTGFNTALNKVEGVWIDNSGASMMLLEGKLDAAAGTIETVSSYTDKVTGKEQTRRNVLTVTDKDRHVLQMFAKGEDGKEFLAAEATFIRSSGPARSGGTPLKAAERPGKPPGAK